MAWRRSCVAIRRHSAISTASRSDSAQASSSADGGWPGRQEPTSDGRGDAAWARRASRPLTAGTPGDGRHSKARRSRSVETFVYTCVVEIEAWPSSSCTTRRSAPWSSMWVAQEWRSTCGLSRSHEPGPRRRSAVTMAQPAWRDRRPPRWLRNTASASPRRAQRAGARAGGGRTAPASRPPRPARADPTGTMRSFAPLPKTRTSALVGVEVAERQPAQLADAHARAVEQLEDGAVPTVDGVVADHGVEQRRHLLLGERLGQPGGHPRCGDVGRGVGRRSGPPRPGSGGGRGRRRVARATEAGARPPARRWPTYAVDVGLVDVAPAAGPRSSSHRHVGGQVAPVRRRACCATGPARPPARSGTPRRRGAGRRSERGGHRGHRPAGPSCASTSSRPITAAALTISPVRAPGGWPRPAGGGRRSCAPPPARGPHAATGRRSEAT